MLVRLLTLTALTALAALTHATPIDDAIGWEALQPSGQWIVARQDGEGVLRSLNGSDVMSGAIAIRRLRAEDDVGTDPYASLHLTDGQRLSGTFVGFLDGGGIDRVRWKNPALGLIDISVERVAGIEFEPSRPSAPQTSADRILLRNGDTVEGFIESFGDPLTVDVAGATQELPLDRVASMWLVSKTQPRKGARIWLADGSILDGAALEGAPAASFIMPGVDLAISNATLPLLVEEVLAVERTPNRTMPLAALVPTVIEATTASLPRASLPTPRLTRRNTPLGASTIEIGGPERLLYEVPKGFTILSAQLNIPASLAHWTDCALIVRQRGVELVRVPLSRSSPSGVVHVPIGEGTLELEVAECGGGPVGDTVLIRRALLIATDGQS